MDKLLQLVAKLRDEIVPSTPLNKMSKPDLIQFIEESNFIQRMRTFHQKGERGIRSTLTDDEDDTLIPSQSEVQKWRVGKLRKLIRTFHRATQILKKYTKFTSARLRSHIKRNRYEEMMFGDDLPVETEDEKEEKPKKKTKHKTKTKEIIKEKLPTGLGNIIINTGVQPVTTECGKCKEDTKSCCCPEEPNKLADQDFFGLIQKLAPNLYKVLAEKAFLLDMCALDRKRMEANVCPIDCRRKAWDDLACCERDVYTTPVNQLRMLDETDMVYQALSVLL